MKKLEASRTSSLFETSKKAGRYVLVAAAIPVAIKAAPASAAMTKQERQHIKKLEKKADADLAKGEYLAFANVVVTMKSAARTGGTEAQTTDTETGGASFLNGQMIVNKQLDEPVDIEWSKAHRRHPNYDTLENGDLIGSITLRGLKPHVTIFPYDSKTMSYERVNPDQPFYGSFAFPADDAGTELVGNLH